MGVVCRDSSSRSMAVLGDRVSSVTPLECSSSSSSNHGCGSSSLVMISNRRCRPGVKSSLGQVVHGKSNKSSGHLNSTPSMRTGSRGILGMMLVKWDGGVVVTLVVVVVVVMVAVVGM